MAKRQCVDEADARRDRIETKARPGQIAEGQARDEAEIDRLAESPEHVDCALGDHGRAGHGVDDLAVGGGLVGEASGDRPIDGIEARSLFVKVVERPHVASASVKAKMLHKLGRRRVAGGPKEDRAAREGAEHLAGCRQDELGAGRPEPDNCYDGTGGRHDRRRGAPGEAEQAVNRSRPGCPHSRRAWSSG